MAGGMQAELNARLISEVPAESNCAVDGLRHSLDFESLKSAFSPLFFLVYVNSPPELRWRRLQRRYPTLDDFQRAESLSPGNEFRCCHHSVEMQPQCSLAKSIVNMRNVESQRWLATLLFFHDWQSLADSFRHERCIRGNWNRP
jgi:hypothetical protein